MKDFDCKLEKEKSLRVAIDLVSSDIKKLRELEKAISECRYPELCDRDDKFGLFMTSVKDFIFSVVTKFGSSDKKESYKIPIQLHDRFKEMITDEAENLEKHLDNLLRDRANSSDH